MRPNGVRTESDFPHRIRFKTSAPQGTCLHPHPPHPPPLQFCAVSWNYLLSLWQPGSWYLKMETSDSTEGSQSRSLHQQPSSEGLGSTSEPFSSDPGPRSALAAATAAVPTAKAATLSANTGAPCSEPSLSTDPSSDSLLREPCTGPSFTHKIGHGRIGFKPVYVSCVARDPCTTNDLSSSPGPVPGSRSGSGSGSGPGHGSGPGRGSGQGTVPDSGPAPVCDSGPSPGHGHDPELSPFTLPGVRNPRADLVPNYAPWNHRHGEPQKQPWKSLQVSEPGARGLWKPPEVEGKRKVLSETLPRGQCLLYNWEEERATNHLDQVPSMQGCSEGFFFRHGHQGLLTLQRQPSTPLSTTHKDSYQPPGNHCQPIRGKREAMLEMLLYPQICLMTTVRSSPKPSGYRGHHSFRCVRVTRHWEWGEGGREEAILCWLGREYDLSSFWHSCRVSVTSRHWTHHSGRTAASPHQCLCPWGSLCPMTLRITPTNWEKSLPLAVRAEDRVVEGEELSKG
ncbi:sperm-associated antigen 8 isoform X3 [Rhinolophus sinicus]|uniref:sperm-associated antigen 8 isoform X3 n=1 Tax=Rhinolophus sinicus TaxID=89399 RepID=UPI003D7A137F